MSLPYLFHYTFLFIMMKVEKFKQQKENFNVHSSYNTIAMFKFHLRE